MRRWHLFWGFFILVYLGLIIYTNRALFFSRFDTVYWKDRYEHSQWKLPLSVRILGDDGLYLYEGYRLIHGEDPTTLNAEVPPLGKYLIGASIKLLGNGNLYGLLTTTLTVFVFYLLAKKITGDSFLGLAASAIFSLDPLLNEQFSLTMLDSLQTLFLLLTFLVLAILLTAKKPSLYQLMALSIAYGLFAGSKAPIFSPFLGMVVIGSLWLKTKKITPILLFGIFSFIIYLLPYVFYFVLGHTFKDWLGVQKWILAFYRQSYIKPNWGSATSTLFLNRYQNLFTGFWEHSSRWSFSWPLITILGMVGYLTSLVKSANRNYFVLPFLGFIILSVIFLTLIPFWTRYLLPILPLLYLGTIIFLKKLKSPLAPVLVISFLLLSNLVASLLLLFPTPHAEAKQALYNIEHGFFQDLYEQTTGDVKKSIDRSSFHRLGQKFMKDGEIAAIYPVIKQASWSAFNSPQEVTVEFTFVTKRLGKFKETKIISLVKERGVWRIPWKWNMLLDELTPERKLQTVVNEAHRGTIYATTNKVKVPLALDFPSLLVSVIPQKVDRNKEEEMLKFLEVIFERKVIAVAFHQAYVGNNQPDWTVDLGIISHPIDETTKQKILSFPGITLTPAYGRWDKKNLYSGIGDVGNTNYSECCSLLYTTTTYDGVRDGLEQKYNDTLKGYNGGDLRIVDKNNKIIRTILETQKKDGQNINLNLPQIAI